VAGADNPSSLIAIFVQGHLAIKAGRAVYVTLCAIMEIVLCSYKICTEEIPAIYNGTETFAEPISYVIKSAGPIPLQ
jgi:hypothetical protein